MRHLSSSSFRLAIKCLVATRRERSTATECPPSLHALDVNELAAYGNVPLVVRLADRLATAMWAIDEALAMCDLDEGTSRETAWIEPEIRHTYDYVNGILKRISN
jgi:hypothetical protein